MGKREGDEKNRDGDQVWGDGGGRRLGVRSKISVGGISGD
jgi:hypothetical protein